MAQTVLAAKVCLVVQAGEAEAIEDPMLTIWQHPAKAAEMGKNARAYSLKHSTLELACHEFEELLSGLTAARA